MATQRRLEFTTHGRGSRDITDDVNAVVRDSGTCLFVGCGIANTTVTQVIRPLLPFFAVMIVVLFIVTYFPWLSLVVPAWFGF